MEDNRTLHLASEKGKIVVNKCLDRKLFINTLKLEKLLIIMHGKMLANHKKTLFKEKVIAVPHGLMIREVDKDFSMYDNEFNKKLPEYVHLLEPEEEVMNDVINEYGSFGPLKINNVEELQILKNICYKGNKPSIVPTEIIETVFSDKNSGIDDLKLVKKLK